MHHLGFKLKAANILIVDDEEIALLTFKQIVSNLGVIHTASSSEEAIKKAKLIRPDLILLDINLDNMDGFEVKSVIEKHFADIPYIFITTSDSYASQAYENGAVDFITKPVDFDTARHRIKNQLERSLSKSALSLANKRIQSMVNNLSDSILLTDSHGLVVDCNNAAEALTGYVRDELIGEDADEILNLRSISNKKSKSLFKEAIEHSKNVIPVAKYLLENRSGQLFEVNCSITTIMDEREIVNGSTGTIRVKKQITGKTHTLDETEIIARIRFLDEIVDKGNIIGDTLAVKVIEYEGLKEIESSLGTDALEQIREDAILALTNALPATSVYGFLNSGKLLIVEPYSCSNKDEFLDPLSLLSTDLNYFGETITFNLKRALDNNTFTDPIELLIESLMS